MRVERDPNKWPWIWSSNLNTCFWRSRYFTLYLSYIFSQKKTKGTSFLTKKYVIVHLLSCWWFGLPKAMSEGDEILNSNWPILRGRDRPWCAKQPCNPRAENIYNPEQNQTGSIVLETCNVKGLFIKHHCPFKRPDWTFTSRAEHRKRLVDWSSVMNLHLAGGAWCKVFSQDRTIGCPRNRLEDTFRTKPWIEILSNRGEVLLMTKHHLNLKQVVLLAKLKYYLNHTLQTNYPLTWLISHSFFACQQLYPTFRCSEEFFNDEVQYNIQKGSYNSGKTEYNPILLSSTTCIPMGFLNGWWVGQVATVAWESKGRVGSGKRPEGLTMWFWGCLPPSKKMKLKWVILYMVYIYTLINPSDVEDSGGSK